MENEIRKIDKERIKQVLLGLRKDVESMYGTFNNIDRQLSTETKITFERNLIQYAFYLSASDGIIDENEVSCINLVLGEKFTIDDVKELITIDNQVAVWDEANGAPDIFEFAATLDRKDNSTRTSEYILSIFDRFGVVLLEIDGAANHGEIADFEKFHKVVKDYIKKASSR